MLSRSDHNVNFYIKKYVLCNNFHSDVGLTHLNWKTRQRHPLSWRGTIPLSHFVNSLKKKLAIFLCGCLFVVESSYRVMSFAGLWTGQQSAAQSLGQANWNFHVDYMCFRTIMKMLIFFQDAQNTTIYITTKFHCPFHISLVNFLILVHAVSYYFNNISLSK